MRYLHKSLIRVLMLSLLAFLAGVFMTGGDKQAEAQSSFEEQTCALSPQMLEGLGRFSVTGQGRFSVTGLGRFTVTGLGRFSVTGLGRFSVTGLSAEEAAQAEAEFLAIQSQVLGNLVDVDAWVSGLGAQIAAEPTFGDHEVVILVVDDGSGDPVSHMEEVVATVNRAIAASPNPALFTVETLDIGALATVEDITTAISNRVDQMLLTHDRVAVNNSYTFFPCVYDGVDLRDVVNYVNNAENVQPVIPAFFCATSARGGYDVYFSYNSLNAETVSVPAGADNNVTATNGWSVSGSPPTSFDPGNNAGAFSVHVSGDGALPVVTWTLRGPDGIVRTASVDLADDGNMACGRSNSDLFEEFVCWQLVGEGDYNLVYRVFNPTTSTISTTPGAESPPNRANWFTEPPKDKGQPGDFPPGFTYFILTGFDGSGNQTWHVRSGTPAVGSIGDPEKECTDGDLGGITGPEPNVGGVSLATYLKNVLGFTDDEIDAWFAGAGSATDDDDLTPLSNLFASFNALSANDPVKRVQSFAAAGNFGDLLGTNTTMYPAILPSVIAVSGEMPDAGNFGSWVSPTIPASVDPPWDEIPSVELSQSGNVVGPAAWVEELSGLFDTTGYMAGTSFSTPLVTVIGGMWLTTDECHFYETHPFLVTAALPKTSNASLLESPGGAPPFNCFNTPPEANDDSYLVWYHQDRYLSVLDNDSDADGDDLSIDGVSAASEGTVSVNTDFADDVLYYVHTAATPLPGATSSDTFDYTLSDGFDTVDGAVNLTIARLDLTCKVATDDEVTWEVFNPVDQSVAFLWDLNTGADSGADSANPGYSTFTTARLGEADNVKILVGGETGFAQQDEATVDSACEDAVYTITNVTVVKYYEDDEAGYQGGEDLLAGWHVTVYDDEGVIRDMGTTDSNGEVSFKLDPGIYTVCETQQEDWENIFPGDECQPLVVEANDALIPGPSTAVVTLNHSGGGGPRQSTFAFEFLGVEGTTWTYRVSEVRGRNLSHWNLGIADCLASITGYTPDSGFQSGTDGSTGFTGIKWNVGSGFSSGEFSFTLDDTYPVGTVEVGAKASTEFSTAPIAGPLCDPQPPDDITVYFGNAEVETTGDLTIVKLVEWSGYEPNNAVTFEICVTGQVPECREANYANGYTVGWSDVATGDYSFYEVDPGVSWQRVYPGGQTATVAAGVNNIYYVRNTYSAPLNIITAVETTIMVTKVVDGDPGAPTGPFRICVTGASAGASYPGGNCVDLNAGESWMWTVAADHTYAISEDDPGPDFSVSGETSVQVAEGQPVNITITNTYTAPQPQCTSDTSVLSGWIDVGAAQATGYITNNAAVPFCGDVGIASYMKFDENISNQFLFDANPLPNAQIQSGQTISLNVLVPNCQAQVDLFWGPVITDLSTGERYGVRLLAAVHSSWLPYCVPVEQD